MAPQTAVTAYTPTPTDAYSSRADTEAVSNTHHFPCYQVLISSLSSAFKIKELYVHM